MEENHRIIYMEVIAYWNAIWKSFSYLVDEEQPLGLISETPIIKRSPTSQASSPSSAQSPVTPRKVSIRVDNKDVENDGCHLTIPKVIAVSSSSETLTGIV